MKRLTESLIGQTSETNNLLVNHENIIRATSWKFGVPWTWKNKHLTASFELLTIFIKEQWRTGTAVALNYMLFGISNSGLTRFYYISDVCQWLMVGIHIYICLPGFGGTRSSRQRLSFTDCATGQTTLESPSRLAEHVDHDNSVQTI